MDSGRSTLLLSPASSGYCSSPAGSNEWRFEDAYHTALHSRKLTEALKREMENICLMNSDVGMKGVSAKEDIGCFFRQEGDKIWPLSTLMYRITRFLSCSSSIYVLAFVYLQRIREYEPRLFMSEQNAHRLYLTAVVLACKYMEDCVNSNRYYAKLGGLSSPKEMNYLEAKFLKLIKFDLAVSPEEYNDMEAYLESIASSA